MSAPGIAPTRAKVRACPVCGGCGVVDEERHDLADAGVVPWGTTDEDFRSSPTLWR
jgi:hypothetical protein